MKKIVLCLMCAFLLTGCTSKVNPTPVQTNNPTETNDPTETKKPDQPANPVETPQSDAISSTQSQGNITVHLPAMAFDGQTKQQIESSVKEKGFKETKVNEDGSVDITMTKEFHVQLMLQLRDELVNNIQRTLSNKQQCPAFEEILYNENLTEFTVICNTQKLNTTESMTPIVLLVTSRLYQAFNATPDLKIVVHMKDKETGEIFDTRDSSEIDDE